MAYELKNGNNYIQAEVVNLHQAMCAITDSFIVSNPGQNYTVSELHHCITYSVKNRFLYGKSDCLSVEELDGGVFPTFVPKRQRRYKRQKVLQNSPKKKRSFGNRRY